jgi:NADH:ubiquinone oxidoreductase subunit 5 (subunit L)/multisubunit Na+/H+ antiporter MnhA subunit
VARLFPLWVIVMLPWLTALAMLALAQAQVRLLGPRKAASFAHYLGLGASALALLFTIQAIDHLLAPDDPRALAHTPLGELLGPIVIGSVRIELTLVADRLSSCATLVLVSGFTLARMFMAGPAGQRELGFGFERTDGSASEPTALAIRRLGLLGLLEGAAILVVLAGDLGLAAIGWATLGLAAAVAVAREVDDERRASAAVRVLVTSLAGDLALGAAAVALVLAGIGLAHTELWAPLTGDRLYAISVVGLGNAELIAALLIAAVSLRLLSVGWAGNSVAEALLDALLIPIPSLYLLLRYQRVLAYAPTTLAVVLLIGLGLAVVAAAVALVRPERGIARRSPRPGAELGLAGTGLAWTGLTLVAIGVGAWRTAVLLILAHALGRLGLRLALVVALDDQLPRWTAQIVRVVGWAVAGIGPGLGFVALAQTLLDALTRTSVLAPWVSWPAAAVVLLVAFLHAAAVARIWFEQLARKPGSRARADAVEEDGLDFAPLALVGAALVGLGLVSLLAWFGLSDSLLAWLDLVLPLAGGHENAPLGVRPEFREGLAIARPWVAGSAALVALVTGFGWMWAREQFFRAHGGELAGLSRALELALALPRRIVWSFALVLVGLTELAARGLGRGLLEQGPQIAARLGRDAQAGIGPRARGLALGGAHQALLGIVAGLALVLGWLFAKPEVASVVPSDGYGFGGLRPKLIRAGGPRTEAGSERDAGEVSGAAADADTDPAADPRSTPLAPGLQDRAEPGAIGPDPTLAPSPTEVER